MNQLKTIPVFVSGMGERSVGDIGTRCFVHVLSFQLYRALVNVFQDPLKVGFKLYVASVITWQYRASERGSWTRRN